MSAILRNYFKALTDVARQGDAREESFYSCLETLLQEVAASTGRSEIHVTTLPKETEAGNPDFRVWNGQDRIIGYIEAKKPAEQNFDSIEASDQLKRYRHTFPNLILTNFFEFRLYRNGQLVDRVLAAKPFVLNEQGRMGCADASAWQARIPGPVYAWRLYTVLQIQHPNCGYRSKRQ